jgi:hypothetical protein
VTVLGPSRLLIPAIALLAIAGCGSDSEEAADTSSTTGGAPIEVTTTEAVASSTTATGQLDGPLIFEGECQSEPGYVLPGDVAEMSELPEDLRINEELAPAYPQVDLTSVAVSSDREQFTAVIRVVGGLDSLEADATGSSAGRAPLHFQIELVPRDWTDAYPPPSLVSYPSTIVIDVDADGVAVTVDPFAGRPFEPPSQIDVQGDSITIRLDAADLPPVPAGEMDMHATSALEGIDEEHGITSVGDACPQDFAMTLPG